MYFNQKNSSEKIIVPALCIIPVFSKAVFFSTRTSGELGIKSNGFNNPGDDIYFCTDEAKGLLRAGDFDAVEILYPRIRKIYPGHFFGSGFIDEVKEIIKNHNILASQNLKHVYIDCEISALQRSRLQKIFECQVITRKALIIGVFAKRARTSEGKLQVSLAHLVLEKTQLVRSWTHLERQRGGKGFLAGPGEKQVELDKRIINDKISRFKKRLQKLVKTRNQQRKLRKDKGYTLVCLVGYTNTGKSTLFNFITEAQNYVKDQLFATLDTTLRKYRLPQGSKIMMSDTVGFISRLPPELISSFKATLDEVRQADIILHVQDVSAKAFAERCVHVDNILAEIGVSTESHKIINIWNKSDKLSMEDLQTYQRQQSDNHILLCATNGQGVQKLLEVIEDKVTRDYNFYRLQIPFSKAKEIEWLYRYCRIVEKDKNCNNNNYLDMSLYICNRYDKQFKNIFATFICR